LRKAAASKRSQKERTPSLPSSHECQTSSCRNEDLLEAWL
jgi:hypothetical protein